jgi:hypothetical protein
MPSIVISPAEVADQENVPPSQDALIESIESVVANVCSAAVDTMAAHKDIQDDIFSPGGVLMIGTLVPTCASVVAVCMPGVDDDRVWLQFWIASGALTYCMEWIDDIAARFPAGGKHWYEMEFFLTLWLVLPFTDGTALVYNHVTALYVAPVAQKIRKHAPPRRLPGPQGHGGVAPREVPGESVPKGSKHLCD